jgi:predicted TIM-barrel fold metal-dependent hydrolase
MAIIDLTGYYGHWPHWPIQVTNRPQLIELLDRTGIDQTVVASTRSIFLNCAEGNAEVYRLSQDSGGRIHSFAVINPVYAESACQMLADAHTAGVKGFRLVPQHHQYRLDDDPVLNEVLALGQELGMAVIIPIRLILHWGLPQLDVREIGVIGQKFPKLKVIIGGVNYGEFRDALGVMRRCENVGFETSCLQLVEGIETLVDKVGVERIYFGTALPLMYPYPALYKIIKARVSDQAKEQILGGNAARLLA